MSREPQTQTTHLNIKSIATYLPPNIRTNNWWPTEIVDRWKKEKNIVDSTKDPFDGARERRVMGPNESIATMELHAATEALEKAKLKISDVDFLFEYSFAPDYLGINDSCLLHKNLNLKKDCFTLTTDGGCNSFLLQLDLAKTLIESGKASHGLLVQGSGSSRVINQEKHMSIHFGDGASAVVVGAGHTQQILAQSNRTDGNYHRLAIFGHADHDWWENGPIHFMVDDHNIQKKVMIESKKMVQDVVEDALSQCGKNKEEVNFFGCHQPVSSFQEEVRKYSELNNAKTLDHYPVTGTMNAVNLPFILQTASENGLLQKDDLVVLYQTGLGVTYSATVIRW